MRDFISKLFEITSLQQDHSIFLIKVKTLFNEKPLFLELEIDQETYYKIESIVTFEDHARYRMSLQSIWNPFQETFMSSITKSKGSYIETCDFICSKHYVKLLKHLYRFQYDENLSEITNLSFIHIQEPSKKKTRPIVKKRTPIAQNVSKYIKPLMAVVVIVTLFFFATNTILISINFYPTTEGDKSVVDVQSEKRKQTTSAFHSVQKKVELQREEGTKEKEATTSEGIFHVESNVIYGLPEGYVAITFDDGPTPYTKEIIDILEEYDTKATFFSLGKNALKYSDSVEYAVSKNMSIGNHSWNHRDFTTLSSEELIDDLTSSNEAIFSKTKKPVTLFRPPYGTFNDLLKNSLSNQNMKMVLWNRDPADWKANSVDELVQFFYDSDPSGAIYLLHEKSNTARALPKILEYLHQQNVELIVLK